MLKKDISPVSIPSLVYFISSILIILKVTRNHSASHVSKLGSPVCNLRLEINVLFDLVLTKAYVRVMSIHVDIPIQYLCYWMAPLWGGHEEEDLLT